VRDGVRRVLFEPSYAAATGRVKREMDEHDAGREGADLLVELAATRRRVSREVPA
jgi:UDP:flavonoid glycosyltransferase YjiC (YdhE family)